MARQLSLVELACFGYTPARVKKGSWLEQTFGSNYKEVDESNGEYIGRLNQDQDEQAGRRPVETVG